MSIYETSTLHVFLYVSAGVVELQKSSIWLAKKNGAHLQVLDKNGLKGPVKRSTKDLLHLAPDKKQKTA